MQTKTKVLKKFSFLELDKDDIEMMSFVENQLRHNIGVNYPKLVDSSINKLRKMSDRKCLLMFLDTRLAGFIIFKTHLSNEFEEFGISKGFELKTLWTNEKITKYLGLIAANLLAEAARIALSYGAKCVFGTVSTKKDRTSQYLLKRGFVTKEAFKDKYLKNSTELLISHPNPEELIELVSTRANVLNY